MAFKIEKDWTTSSGLRAVIIRIILDPKVAEIQSRYDSEVNGHRCGYVGVPEHHILSGEGYTNIDVDVDVHGGLTYSDGTATYPVPTEGNSTWWFGYDCAHYEDNEDGGQSLEYCISECESLAQQLANYKETKMDE